MGDGFNVREYWWNNTIPITNLLFCRGYFLCAYFTKEYNYRRNTTIIGFCDKKN
jgi:hypothetical protein